MSKKIDIKKLAQMAKGSGKLKGAIPTRAKGMSLVRNAPAMND